MTVIFLLQIIVYRYWATSVFVLKVYPLWRFEENFLKGKISGLRLRQEVFNGNASRRITTRSYSEDLVNQHHVSQEAKVLRTSGMILRVEGRIHDHRPT